MEWDDLYLVSDKLDPVARDRIQKVEVALGVRFPVHYAEFISVLGGGEYNGHARIFSPELALERTAATAEIWSENPSYEGPLSEADLKSAVCVGQTVDRDLLVFLPDNPDHIYVASLINASTQHLGVGLAEALARLDALYAPDHSGGLRYFHSHRDQTSESYTWSGKAVPFADFELMLLNTIPHEHRFGRQSDSLRVLIKDFYGTVDVLGNFYDPSGNFGKDIYLELRYDTTLASSVLERLKRWLEGIGFVRQDA